MTALLVGLACFGCHAVVTLVWLRLPGRISPVARHAVSALGTHILGIGLAAGTVGPFSYWPAAAVSGFGTVIWLFAFSAVYKSVSLRLLTELARTPGASLSLAAITEEFVRPEFQGRVRVLLRMGCAIEVDGEYELTAKGKDIARRIEMVRRACGVEGSGLYGEPARLSSPAA